MKLHPLHEAEWVAKYVLCTGEYPGDRATGRTEALALEWVARAIREPRKWHYPQDHHRTQLAHDILSHRCREIVQQLGLRGFTFRRDSMTLGLPEQGPK